MGVGYHGLQIALLGKKRGVNFSRTISIARQHHYLDAATLQSMFVRFGLSLTEGEQAGVLHGPFSEGLFRKLGATLVDSIDASDYEGASIIHDFNEPVSQSLHRKYTVVVDFGSLEHIFHFPNAIKNVTDLLDVGGHFISMSVANNFMGHGFYQFSPELFFSYLPANGFSDLEIYLVPFRIFPFFFRVAEPRELGGRVELVNSEPVQIGVIARKVKHVSSPVIPMQSDYQQQFWRGRDVNRRTRGAFVDPKLSQAMSEYKARLASLLAWPETVSPELVNGFENSLQYQLVDPAKE
ncbi:hypothetical protein [Bradyrhizobium sp. ORS 111]|uniref:hypothetical protein n=1 Tax=Bradyrhizobium sp. ORS 111 TaxID=1685958 RepID=UPI003890DD3B